MGNYNLGGRLEEKVLSDDIKADALNRLIFIGLWILEFSGAL